MRTIYEAKQFIKDNLGKTVKIQVLGIRNKITYVEGTISECYPNIFLIDVGNMKKSYTYTDVLIGNILVNVK